MKKSILFVIDSLHCAGAEKSLTTLLSLIDYSKYSVDLQLFGYGGSFEKLIPKEVNLLQELEYMNFLKTTLRECFKESNNKEKILSRIKYSIAIRIKKNDSVEKARIFWKYSSINFNDVEKEYDIAIAYAQGIPTFYVADKIKAKNKYSWVNVSHNYKWIDKKYNERYYREFCKINAVSESTRDVFIDNFPMFKNKMVVIKDINDFNFINKMSRIGESYSDNFEGIKLLTIGRLANQKGYDFALDACKELKKSGINFRWYVLGKGDMEKEILNRVRKESLQDNFKLLGVTDNPYSYIKDCDIYVQTSRFEGFGIAIAEARMLNKPIVTTKFDAVFTQMIDRKNGLVVEMNGKSIANGIIELIENNELRNSIIKYLEQEKKGNLEELEKFYELIS